MRKQVAIRAIILQSTSDVPEGRSHLQRECLISQCGTLWPPAKLEELIVHSDEEGTMKGAVQTLQRQKVVAKLTPYIPFQSSPNRVKASCLMLSSTTQIPKQQRSGSRKRCWGYINVVV